MKQRLSSLDIRAITNELDRHCRGKFVQNFYSFQQRFIYIKLSTKDIILIEPGIRMHLSNTCDSEISHFCKKLRERCRHARINRIYQPSFDRVVIIDIQRCKIVVEFFSAGNILIIDENDVILEILRPVPELKISKGERYIWNNVEIELSLSGYKEKGLASVLPFETEYVKYISECISGMSDCELVEYFEKLEKEIRMHGDFGEVVLKGGKPESLYSFPSVKEGGNQIVSVLKPTVEKNRYAESRDIKDRYAESRDIKDNIKDSNDNKDNNKDDIKESDLICQLNISNPIKLIAYDVITRTISENKGIKALHFETMNAATEYAYFETKKIAKMKEEKSERIKKAQKKYIDELERQGKAHEDVANLIEENKEKIGRILKVFQKVYESRMSWDVFEGIWEEEKESGNPDSLSILSFDLGKKRALVEIAEGTVVELNLGESLSRNIEEQYGRRRKAIEKSSKTRAAMAKGAVHQSSGPRVKPQQRVPFWFEKFNFFFTSSGRLAIGGKNVQGNEQIVKSHMESADLYFHCDVHGGSSVVLKTGPETASPREIEEAAYMALGCSKAWEEGVIRPVFYVGGSQVSKSAPTGEYLARGSFVISGKKSFVSLHRIEYGIGLVFKRRGPAEASGAFEFPGVFDGSWAVEDAEFAFPVAAPWSVVKSYKYRARIVPGNEKKSQVCQAVLRLFQGQARDTPEETMVFSIGEDEYMRVVLGKSRIGKIDR